MLKKTFNIKVFFFISGYQYKKPAGKKLNRQVHLPYLITRR